MEPPIARTPKPAALDKTFLDMGHEREMIVQSRQPALGSSAVAFAWRALFLPIMGIIFLAFCYTCHYRLVEVGTATGLLSQLPIVKAGVTSLSIIFVSLSLLPLSSLLSDLKSEEFFRALSDKRQGIRLASLNNASTPSRGLWDSLVVLGLRQGSNYYASAFLAGLILLAASTLAPATLSVDTVLFDGDLVALPIGAVSSNTVMQLGNFSFPRVMDLSDVLTEKSSKAGSLAWAEVSLGINYSFISPTADQTTYVVPTPLNLTTNITASWLSDVVAMRPVCEWIAPHILDDSVNTSDTHAPDVFMNLDSKGVQIQLSVTDVSLFTDQINPTITSLRSNWSEGGFSGQMRRFDTHDDLTDGSAVWMFMKCSADCKPTFGQTPIDFIFGPEFHSTRLVYTGGQAFNFSFLFCTPNAEIQTRRVHNDGTGLMAVGDVVPVRQGNLHAAQTKLLLSYIFKEFEEAGPKGPSIYNGIGNEAQISLFFGNNPIVEGGQLPLSPIDTITKYYGRFLQSGMKNFLDGSIASAYVPSRATRKMTVLSPSMPHVIVSTVLYVILSIFVIVCHFRRPYPHFTLSAVAASLEKSPIPPLFDQYKHSGSGTCAEDHAMASLGSARVVLEKGSDGSQVLKLRKTLSESTTADHEMLEI